MAIFEAATLAAVVGGLNQVGHQVAGLLGPAPAAGQASLRARASPAFNDLFVTRALDQDLNRRACDPRNATDSGYINVLPGIGEYLHMLHRQRPDARTGRLPNSSWDWIHDRLRYHGIDLSQPEGGSPWAIANDWEQIAQWGASIASLDAYIGDYYRSAALGQEVQREARDRLDWALRHGGHSRPEDRTLLEAPWRDWSHGEIMRLHWFGLVNDDERRALFAAGGTARQQDYGYALQLARILPPPTTLFHWDARSLYSDDLANKYGLDIGGPGLENAHFWSKAQGLGQQHPALPGQPEQGNDWLKMEQRASKPVPGFAEALELQWRLRPSAADPAQSVVPGAPTWTEQNTRDVLALHGYTEPVIEWMMGLQATPLSFRIANHILVPSLRDQGIDREARAQLGPPEEWLTGMFMDHGQPQVRARLLAKGLLEQADRSANAERWEQIKQQRKQWRDTYLAGYELGTVSYADAHQQIQDDWFNDSMATRALAIVDQERSMGVVKRQLAALRSTWMRGAISSEQATTAMAALGIVGPRQEQYGLEWRWERTEAVRILNTGEILTALKNGLLTPQTAIARLLAMGWSQPDALVEVAQAEQAVAAARQKVATAQQRTITTAREKQQRAQALAAAKAAKAAATADAQARKLSLAEVLAPHRLLMAQSKYYAAVHQGNAEYAQAEKKHDEEKQAAILQRQVAEYHGWLLSQLKTVAGVNDGTASESSIDSTPAPGAGEGG